MKVAVMTPEIIRPWLSIKLVMPVLTLSISFPFWGMAVAAAPQT